MFAQRWWGGKRVKVIRKSCTSWGLSVFQFFSSILQKLSVCFDVVDNFFFSTLSYLYRFCDCFGFCFQHRTQTQFLSPLSIRFFFCTRFSRLLCHVHHFCVTIGAIHLYKPGGRWQREIKIYKVPPLGRMSKELKWSNFIFQQRQRESDTTEIAVNVSSSHTAHNSYSQQSDSWLAWVEAAAVVCTPEKKNVKNVIFSLSFVANGSWQRAR